MADLHNIFIIKLRGLFLPQPDTAMACNGLAATEQVLRLQLAYLETLLQQRIGLLITGAKYLSPAPLISQYLYGLQILELTKPELLAIVQQ